MLDIVDKTFGVLKFIEILEKDGKGVVYKKLLNIDNIVFISRDVNHNIIRIDTLQSIHKVHKDHVKLIYEKHIDEAIRNLLK